MDDPQPQSIPWRKWLRNAGITLGVLLLLTLTFYLYENVCGESTWRKTKAQLEAQGEQLDFAAFIPSPGPEEINFAFTPFLAPLNAFECDPESGVKLADSQVRIRILDSFRNWKVILSSHWYPSPYWNKGIHHGNPTNLKRLWFALHENPPLSGPQPRRT